MAGCSWHGLSSVPYQCGCIPGQPPRVVPSYSQAMSQIDSLKLEGHNIPGCHALGLQGEALM